MVTLLNFKHGQETMMELSQDGKEELALALLLWKYFKSQGKMDIEVFKKMFQLADHLGIRPELEKLNKEILMPFRISLEA